GVYVLNPCKSKNVTPTVHRTNNIVCFTGERFLNLSLSSDSKNAGMTVTADRYRATIAAMRRGMFFSDRKSGHIYICIGK
ncbi:hypothetical protein AAB138_RS27995, partial [Escherichia coli]